MFTFLYRRQHSQETGRNAGGPTAVSLRAIARDMGMTAPAIYRYFPSLDALVGAVCADLFRELQDAITTARDRLPVDTPGPRLAAMARAFRHWAIHHHAEFGALWRRHDLRTPAPEVVSQAFTAHLAPGLAEYAGDLPPEVIYLFLSGWTRLYGLVAMEVFGQLSWAVTDYEPLFESEIATFLHQLTGGSLR